MTSAISSTQRSSSAANTMGTSAAKPPKYAAGKINPEWVAWNAAQNKANGSNAPGTTIPNIQMAPPVVCSMQEKFELDQSIGKEVAFTVQTEQAFEKIQNPEYASRVGLDADDIVDELGKVMAKYEIPVGLTSKLIELSTYDQIEFVLDDSGSMNSMSDTLDVRGNPRTRKDEALARVLEMVEVLSYIKTPVIKFRFLNHNNRHICLELVRQGERPADFFESNKCKIESMWTKPTWSYSTPMKETIEKSFSDSVGKRVVRYIFGDGVPDNTASSIHAIEQMFKNRRGSRDNPVTFMSCTNVDKDVEWMTHLEEKADHCSESDDYNDELAEVRGDQGEAFPFTKGFYIACELVAAMNPDDLDCMDESVPFTKQDFDLLQGYISDEAGYKKYFDGFLTAQEVRKRKNGHSAEDRVKNSMDWKSLYHEFLRQTHAGAISAVRDYRGRLNAT